jgi:uncharacterized protein
MISRFRLRFSAGIAVALVLAIPVFSATGLHGYVTDEMGALTPESMARMTAISEELKQKTGVELATYLPKSIGDSSIEEFAETAFASAKIGEKGKDNGVLLVMALNERKVRIEVGYGLEGALPDGKAGELIRELIVPRMKAKKISEAVEAGHFGIAYHIAAQEGVTLTGKPKLSQARAPGKSLGFWILAVFLFLIFGGGGRWLPWMILGAALPRDRFGGGGFGGGGGGFGGFGGGSSGGGGASGSW